MAAFERRRSLTNPTIYHTFKARDLHSNQIIEFRVQDFPLDRIEEGIQYMIQNFFEDEVMGKTRRIKSDRQAVLEISQFWREVLQRGFSIACFKENSNDIIAMNVLSVSSVNDKKSNAHFQSQNLNDIFGVMDYAKQEFNTFEHYNVDEYLIAYGLCVDTEYRGRGIATEMLKARAPLLKAFNLKVTTTAFTGIGSQVAAKKAGYEENFSIKYDDLYHMNTDFYFPGITSTHFKTMSLTV